MKNDILEGVVYITNSILFLLYCRKNPMNINERIAYRYDLCIV